MANEKSGAPYSLPIDKSDLQKLRSEANSIWEGMASDASNHITSIERTVALAGKNISAALKGISAGNKAGDIFSGLFKDVKIFEQVTDGGFETLKTKFEELRATMEESLDPSDLKEFQEKYDELVNGDSTDQFRAKLIEMRKALEGSDEMKNDPPEKDKGYEQKKNVLSEIINNLKAELSVVDFQIEASVQTEDSEKLLKLTEEREKLEAEILKTQGKHAQKETDRQKKINESVRSVGELGSNIVDSGKALSGMIESFGFEIPSEVTTVLNGFDKIFGSLKEFDVSNPFSVITSSFGVVEGLVGTITGLFGGKPSGLTQRDFEVYGNLITIFDELINKQKELISVLAGGEALEAIAKSEEMIENRAKQTREMINDWLNTGASWKSSSWGKNEMKHIRKYADELKKIGIDISDWGKRGTGKDDGTFTTGLASLTAEQLENIKWTMPKFWAELPDDLRGILENIIEANVQLKELEKTAKETFAGFSFDSLINSFDDLVMKADLAFGDVEKMFEDLLLQCILNFVKNKYLLKELEAWYDTFALLAEPGKFGNGDDLLELSLDEDELNSLIKQIEAVQKALDSMGEDFMDENDDEVFGLDENKVDFLTDWLWGIVDGANEKAQRLKEMFGLGGTDADRSGASKGIAQASQDSVNELNGRMTVIQSHTYGIFQNTNTLVQQSRSVINSLMGTGMNSSAYAKVSAIPASSQLTELSPVADAKFSEIAYSTKQVEFHMGGIVGTWRQLQQDSAAALRHLSGIEGNTEFCRRLEPIQHTLEDISTRGVRIRE